MPDHELQCLLFSSNRHGGVSQGPYQSLNLSYGVGDCKNAVSKNRQCLKTHHSINTLLSARQVHGDRTFIASTPLTEDLEVDGYDALITHLPNIGLMIQQADCQAVTLYDPIHAVIAAIHCGWKGSVLNILTKTTQAMERHYNCSPADLHATISPSLGPCCAEFINHHQELPSSFLAFQVKENYFDFWRISKMQLVEAGLEEENIHTVGQCTSCSPDYFSYRRANRNSDGRTGRCATAIVLQ